MRPLTAILLIALATAGCIGSTGAPSSTDTGASTAQEVGTLPPRTNLLITYTASAVPTCPPGAKCLPAQGQSYYIVRRRLTCSPDGGAYDNPTAVCNALDRVIKSVARAHPACLCPIGREPRAKAVGYYNGNRRTIPLDWCTLCNVKASPADIELLMPGAQS